VVRIIPCWGAYQIKGCSVARAQRRVNDKLESSITKKIKEIFPSTKMKKPPGRRLAREQRTEGVPEEGV